MPSSAAWGSQSACIRRHLPPGQPEPPIRRPPGVRPPAPLGAGWPLCSGEDRAASGGLRTAKGGSGPASFALATLRSALVTSQGPPQASSHDAPLWAHDFISHSIISALSCPAASQPRAPPGFSARPRARPTGTHRHARRTAQRPLKHHAYSPPTPTSLSPTGPAMRQPLKTRTARFIVTGPPSRLDLHTDMHSESSQYSTPPAPYTFVRAAY